MSRKDRLEDLFDAGLNLEKAREWLLQSCNDDPDLKKELDDLWSHSEDADTIFDLKKVDGDETIEFTAPTAKEGAENKYEIREVIASGGMGTVYRAEQQFPIQRIVALKVLENRFSREMSERFRMEGQVLAMLAHPYIAQVYDYGITIEGDPYIAMEYIDGEPISNYCDRVALNIKDRLNLFRKICEGLEHAHQKGIIHRDIKPNNIMVIEHDGKPIPKIIDFGIARFTDKDAMVQPHRTRAGTVIGTPHYMSPEQAGGFHEQTDTRTDIYSLGVVLYQLLTGVIPLDQHLNNETSLQECCRIIREVEPQPPSKRILLEDERFDQIAGKRGCGSARELAALIKGDLDWVALKALAKHPEDRYTGCTQLAADLGYYLQNRPLIAGPPGNIYHARKFFRRYRPQLITSAVFLLAGLISVSVFLVQQQRANHRISLINGYMTSIITNMTPRMESQEANSAQTLRQIADEADSVLSHRGLGEANLRRALGSAFANLGLDEEAAQQYQEGINLYSSLSTPKRVVWDLRAKMAHSLSRLGRIDEAQDQYKTVLAEIAANPGASTPRQALWLKALYGFFLNEIDAFEEAVDVLTACIEQIPQTNLSPERSLRIQMGLASSYAGKQKFKEAEAVYVKHLTDIINSEDPSEEAGTARHNYGNLLIRMRRYSDAQTYHQLNFNIRSRTLVPNHERTLNSLSRLGWAQYRQAKREGAKSKNYNPLLDEAERNLSYVYQQEKAGYGRNHHRTMTTINDLAHVVHMRNKQAAVDLLAQTDNLSDTVRRHPKVINTRNTYGDYLIRVQDYQNADRVLRQTLEDSIAVTGEGHQTALVLLTLGELHEIINKPEDALAFYRRGVDAEPNKRTAAFWRMRLLAEALKNNGNPDQARAEINKAAETLGQTREVKRRLAALDKK